MDNISVVDIGAFTRTTVSEEYPRFEIDCPNRPLILVQEILIPGTVPIYVKLNEEKTKLFFKCSESTINVKRMLAAVNFIWYVDEEKRKHKIETVLDYVEVV